MTSRKTVIATRNAHKLEEIRAIFDWSEGDVLSAFDFPALPEVEEDGDSLEANAAKKALETARATGLRALADDSGLEVRALNGAPGVRSARYAGEACSYAENNAKLLSELADATDRSARFRTVVALAEPDGTVDLVEGICAGRIVEVPRGENGFGYDPLFVPEDLDRTFAELSAEEKNRVSHRAKALRAAKKAWGRALG